MDCGHGGPAGPPGPDSGFDCASFNQDSTSLALGMKSGYKLFSLSSVDTLSCIYESVETPEVCLVERLFCSSLVVVVSSQMPQRMNIYHFKKGTEICNYSYPSPVHAVKLNRQRLVVCLEESIYIHNIKDMKLLKTLLNTPANPSGLCALSVSPSSSYMAYPGSANSGEVVLYDANALSTVTVIPAHSSSLAALSFNPSASKLASASERGTVIRVFSIPNGQLLSEFRRGMKRYVHISCLSFSPDGQFLCASSNTETVHIFKMEPNPNTDQSEEDDSWGSYVGKMINAASTYLPAPVSGMMSQDRAFATAHLLTSGRKNTCTLAMIQKLPRLLVATADSQLFIYTLDLQEGGECKLAYTHKLFELNRVQHEETGSEGLVPRHTCATYASTAARPPVAGSGAATLTGYCEDAGCKNGEVVPEHELAAGPVCLDDESEFPPIK